MWWRNYSQKRFWGIGIGHRCLDLWINDLKFYTVLEAALALRGGHPCRAVICGVWGLWTVSRVESSMRAHLAFRGLSCW